MQFDLTKHNPDPQYLRSILEALGMSQRQSARMLGLSERMMRYYLSDPNSENYREAPYLVQFALESLLEQVSFESDQSKPTA